MPRACKRCGRCCENITLLHGRKGITEVMAEAVRLNQQERVEGFQFMLDSWKWKKRLKGGQWHCECKWYVPPNNGNKANCLKRETRPPICKNYPYGKGAENDNCGYKKRKTKGEQVKCQT